jgi:hypothetical protein
MPHLTFQIGPTGPLLDVIVTVSKPRADALTKAGQPTPAPVQARLLIDTGASGTAIDPSILTKLGLSPTGIMTIHTPSTGPQGHQVNQYDVGLAIQYQGLARQFLALPVGECSLNAQGIDGLLGRDVLAHCLFIYTGPDNAFILSF